MTLDDLKERLGRNPQLLFQPGFCAEWLSMMMEIYKGDQMEVGNDVAVVFKLLYQQGQQDALGKLREKFEAWEVWETPETVSLKYREALKNDPGLNAGKAMNWLKAKALKAIDDLRASLSDKV